MYTKLRKEKYRILTRMPWLSDWTKKFAKIRKFLVGGFWDFERVRICEEKRGKRVENTPNPYLN